jgi:hypothetical protein
MGRPRKYASDAEKQAAFRERNAILSIRVDPHVKETIERLAESQGWSVSDYATSMLKFALLNRNWSVLGFFGKPLPRANPLECDECDMK